MIKMTSDALTNVGKQFMSNVACACSQRYTKDFSLLIGPNAVCYDVK